MIKALTYAAAATLSVLQGSQHATDGDTIRIGGTRIRLEGIDAPELTQTCTRADGAKWRCGEMAKAALNQKIANQPVRCVISGIDKYKRSIGTCSVGKLNLNQWLVQSGWAVAYQRYSTAYVTDEQAARSHRLNIWSGKFLNPADYRSGKRHPQ